MSNLIGTDYDSVVKGQSYHYIDSIMKADVTIMDIDHSFNEYKFKLMINRCNIKPSILTFWLIIQKERIDASAGQPQLLDRESSPMQFRYITQSSERYQTLFNHMHNVHGLILLESEMQEILRICREIDTLKMV